MRIAVVGVGAVGEACAHLLVSSGTARSLVLANRNLDVANAVRMDLEQSRSWTTPLSARAVEPWREGAFRGCDVLILTAGPRLRGHESRAEKAAETARLLTGAPGRSMTEALADHARTDDRTVLLVVTNPVEATVTWLAEQTGWARSRIVGLGTTVETARFSRFLADALNVDASSVWTEIIGEHGPLIEVRDPDALRRRILQLKGREIDVEQLLERTRRAAEVIRKQSEGVGATQARRLLERLQRKLGADVLPLALEEAMQGELAAALSPPATRFAIAAAACEVVEAVGSDRGRVLPVSGFAGFEGQPDVALALPFVVGRAGLLRSYFDAPTELLRRAGRSIDDQVAAMRLAVSRPPSDS